MEGTLIMEYQLTITFAGLGHHEELPDLLLALLLDRVADAGPTLAHNQVTGTLTVLLSFESSKPIEDFSRMSKTLAAALLDTGLETAPTVVDVHLAAVHESDEGPVGIPGVLSLA
jgi:hypothetical protein